MLYLHFCTCKGVTSPWPAAMMVVYFGVTVGARLKARSPRSVERNELAAEVLWGLCG